MAAREVLVGGKGSSLSASAVYAIACGTGKAAIDPAALGKSSASKSPSTTLSSCPPAPRPSRFLAADESRAALAVLLNKLVRSDSAIRPELPRLIERALALPSGHETLDFGSSVQLLKSLYSLSGSDCYDAEVGAAELRLVESSCAAALGISAILDCCGSVLAKLSDAVAAVSCEAARANVSALDVPISGDGFSNKDKSDVAGDMKDLLLGSKLVGLVDSGLVAKIPAIHGRFREAIRSWHAATRIELNSVVSGKDSCVANCDAVEEALVASVLPLAKSVLSMMENSLGRSELVIASLPNKDVQSKLKNVAGANGCPKIVELRDEYRSIASGSVSGSDCIAFFHQTYDFLVKLRGVLAWEAALSLFSLEIDESVENPDSAASEDIVNGEPAKGGKKSKKKKTLGKGTSVVRQVLKDRIATQTSFSCENVTYLDNWVRDFDSYFDPKDAQLDTLLGKVKEIVESNEVKRLPKIPKGTRDFGKEQMAIRRRAFSTITRVFQMHGAVELDTPVFELRETLMGKYGEDSKLIYDLADQGGELCSLRYDLTVPFSRYLAMNNISSLKRYQIAKVYRRDNPAKGRYREFYQCDFDIAGQYEPMEPDFEVLRVLTELLNQLNIGEYEIKLNHRKILDGMLETCGVSSEKFRTVCSSIDKLDKQSFAQIKKELVVEKGLTNETAEMIGTYVKKRGPPHDILSELMAENSQLLEISGSSCALKELKILFDALQRSNCLDKIVFDLSLARGLDYYTGVIFEAVFKGSSQVGSIAAGGRYDNLVGMFGKQVPAVGMSLGIERVFAIMEQMEKERNQGVTRPTETQVLVAILNKDGLCLAAEVVSKLWDAGVKAEFGLTKRIMNHINRAKQSGIPWMVIVGDEEVKSGIFKLKDVGANKEEQVPRDRLVEEIQVRLNIVAA